MNVESLTVSTETEADATAKLNVSSHRKRKKFGVSTFETDEVTAHGNNENEN